MWLQLVIGWVPVWALYTALIVSQHQPVSLGRAAALGARSLLPAALLGVLVHRLLKRVPWPRPFRLRFALLHSRRGAGVCRGVDPVDERGGERASPAARASS